jgi:hypothetical protein
MAAAIKLFRVVFLAISLGKQVMRPFLFWQQIVAMTRLRDVQAPDSKVISVFSRQAERTKPECHINYQSQTAVLNCETKTGIIQFSYFSDSHEYLYYKTTLLHDEQEENG